MDTSGLLSRAIVVINAAGNVVYTEQVPEIAQEPDYDSALAAATLMGFRFNNLKDRPKGVVRSLRSNSTSFAKPFRTRAANSILLSFDPNSCIYYLLIAIQFRSIKRL